MEHDAAGERDNREILFDDIEVGGFTLSLSKVFIGLLVLVLAHVVAALYHGAWPPGSP